MYVKIAPKEEGGSAYLYPAEKVVWSPTHKSIAEEMVFQGAIKTHLIYDDKTLEIGSLTDIQISNREHLVVDVVKYNVWIMNESGQTIDRIP